MPAASAWPNFCARSAWTSPQCLASRTNFPEANASASASHARWPCARNLSLPTSRFRPSTSAWARRSSICCSQLQREFGLTYLFISHSMPVVRYLSTRIAVMYRGKIVEVGTTAEITERPQSDYTKSLLAATPEIAV